MFIIDFDDTLFDTHRFKSTLTEALQKAGVSLEDADWSYKMAYSTDGKFTHSNKRRAEYLGTRGYDEAKVLTSLEEVTTSNSLKDHVLPGAYALLESLKGFEQPLILLSLGDPEFQEIKVRGSGVDTYFDRLFMVSDSKEKIISELISHHSPVYYWLINDKVDESKKITEKFPSMQIVLKQSARISEEEYQNSGFKYFKELSEIQRYVQNNYTK